jgi:hypothetical protein
MSGFGWVGDAVAATFMVAVLFMLVRPGSPAVDLIDAFTGAFTGLLAVATGTHP